VLRSEWPAIVAACMPAEQSPYLPPTHDQNGVGMCNCSATTGAMESQRMKQGLGYLKLSAGDLYNRIHVGRGDNGSLLEDGIHEASTVGVAGVAVVPYLDWQRSYAGAAADRPRFRVLEAYLCPEFDHCFSAVAAGFDLISGISWFSNYTPDSDGWLPAPRGKSGGHAIHGYKPTMRNGRYGIWHQNSWSDRWGIHGRFVIPEACYDNAIGGWWAVRSVVDEGGVVPSLKA